MHTLLKQIVKNWIISFNEEIYDSIQKLVYYLSQKRPYKNVKIKIYEFTLPKQQIT